MKLQLIHPDGRMSRRRKASRACSFTRTALLLLGALLLCGAPASTAWAQAVFGSIVGTVTDASGAVVPNATITVTDITKGTIQTVQSNSSGNYTVSRLIPDTYSVKAEAQGFTPSEVGNVIIVADSTQQVNMTMQVSGSSQTVTVTAAPPPLQTESADVNQVLTEQQFQNLPNLNRNFTSFGLLAPGVQRSNLVTAPTENPQGTLNLTVNGSNFGSVGYVLDGTDNRDAVLGIIVINPTLDSISETKIDTEDFPAEFGGAPAGVVLAQTRSGSNSLHGDAFLFRRSDALEARDPFTQFARNAVTNRFIPSALYSQFGGAIGGPIIKDKAFFFGDYQGTRQRTGFSLSENVPTAEVRNTCLNAASPTCDLTQYGGAVIPNSLVTPQGVALLSALPAPNAGTPGAIANNYVGSGSGNNDQNQADIRLDDQVTANLHAFTRYDYAKFSLFGAPVFGAAGGAGFGLGGTAGTHKIQNQSAAAGFDWAIHPNLLTDFRFGFLSYHVIGKLFDDGTTPAANDGIPNLNTGVGDTTGSPAYIVADGSVSSFGAVGTAVCNCPLHESEQVFQFANNWTRIYGNHEIRFGGDFRYGKNLRSASDFNRSGQLTFNNSTVDASGNKPGSGLGAILEGQIAQFQRFDVYANSGERQKRLFFYGQDTWRVTPRLTLNYGVRWDIIYPETIPLAGGGGFADLQAGVIRVEGVGGVPSNGGQKLDPLDLAGRFGFAYQLRSGTVIRGALGTVYDSVGYNGTIFGTVSTHDIPVVTAESVGGASGTSPVYSYATIPAQPAPFPVPANGLIPVLNGLGFEVRGNRLILPKVDQYNLSLQQQLTNNMTFTLGYVGNVFEHTQPGESAGYNINLPVLPTTPADLAAKDPAVPTPCTPGSPLGCSRNQRRPHYDQFAQPYNGATQICCSQDIVSVYPGGRTNYNALQTSLNQRFAHGVQLMANFTWSRALNYSGKNSYFSNNPRTDYGPNDSNRNRVFVLSGLYELPFGHDKMFANTSNRLINYAVGGWQLAGTTTWESGLAFTPTYDECATVEDVDTNHSAPSPTSDCRPDKVANGPGSGFVLKPRSFNPLTHSVQYFAPVAPLSASGVVSGPFAAPAFGAIGNVGRNSLRGPSDYFADASLFKNFKITERVQGQFQLQAFNVFNHVPLGLLSATNARCIDCQTGAAGQITSVDAPLVTSGLPYMRQLQFGARFSF